MQLIGNQKRQSNICGASSISRAHHSGLTNFRTAVQLPSIDRGRDLEREEVHSVTYLTHMQLWDLIRYKIIQLVFEL